MDTTIKESKQAWKDATLKKATNRFPPRLPDVKTTSDIEVDYIYAPEDLEGFDYMKNLGFPGEYPFTRGVQPTMYRGKLWTMRQYAGMADAEATNKRYLFLLEKGQTGLSVAFDLPTQLGLDSDDERSLGEVGRVGVAIDSIEDMETLFNMIPLDKVSTSMTINATACILLAMYIVVAENQGVSKEKIKGTVQNDILKEYCARGNYVYPAPPSMRLTGDLIEYTSKYIPRWNPISISGYHIREAGSSAAQEIAFTLSNAGAYVRSVLERGLNVDEFAPRLSFFFASHNNLLEEVAKFRAVRRMWARMMKEEFGAKSIKSCKLRFHTQTGGVTLTSQQPLNNVVRVTMQALAAVLGGTQSLHTNSYDEALCLPTEEAVTVALRTQQIIGYESGVTETIDPLAGSYFVEKMTDDLEKAAMEIMEEVEKRGGAVKSIEEGYIQREIHNSAYKLQTAAEKDERIIVGVNKFTTDEKEKVALLSIDPDMERKQVEKLRAFKEKRDNGKISQILDKIKEKSRTNENIMPLFIDAVRDGATVGEISNALRDEWGEYVDRAH
ncbi:MAG: methylmalonyl-CoA mutase family protein [Candidatus Eremiobacteraeota bacterium]|nr:methylmalonyl-CoA mutase family protein [Candidatus Eremiobacteraeota bacterium]